MVPVIAFESLTKNLRIPPSKLRLAVIERLQTRSGRVSQTRSLFTDTRRPWMRDWQCIEEVL